MTRRPSAILKLFSGLLLVLLVLAIPQPASASGTTARIQADRPAAKVLDYWTKARMRAADPVPTELPGKPRPTSAPAEAASAPSYVPPATPGSDAGSSSARR